MTDEDLVAEVRKRHAERVIQKYAGNVYTGFCECGMRIDHCDAIRLVHVIEQRDAEIDRLTKLIEAKDEYMALLEEELGDTVPMATVHGWRSHRVEAGEKARAKIAALTEVKE